ncbi:hypothetical protein Tco_1406340 [Tanacetum coccineum]
MLTKEEQLAADTMQAIKASKKVSRSQSHIGDSSEGAGITPEVPDESTDKITTLSKGAGITPEVLDEAKASSTAKADAAIDCGSEEESDWSDEAHVNEDIDIEETDDEDEYAGNEAREYKYVHEDEYFHNDADEEMKDGENAKIGIYDEEITDAEKADAEKSEATKGDYDHVGKLPPKSSSLSVSSGFGNKFLNLSSDTFLVSTTKESANTKINSLLDIQTQQEVPQIQSPPLLKVLVLVISEQTNLSTAPPQASIITTISSVLQQATPIPTPPITTVTPPVTTVILDPLPAIIQRLSGLESQFEAWKKLIILRLLKI